MVSGDENRVVYSYRYTDDGSPDIANLYYDIPGAFELAVITSNGITDDGFYHEAEILWDGMVSNWNDRRYPIAPGAYTTIQIHSLYPRKSNQFFVNVIANGWDSDGDGISNAVEDENNGVSGGAETPIVDVDDVLHHGWYQSNSLNFPPQISTNLPSSNILYRNRKLHDYSIAKGALTNGLLHNGLRIAHRSTGYRYWRNTDPINSDNWGTLELVNLIEVVGRKWSVAHSTYPMMTLDMSRQGGGSFRPDHEFHQNGLSLDACYIGTGNFDETTLYNNYVLITENEYDTGLTYSLLEHFLNNGKIYRIYTDDQLLYNLSPDDVIVSGGGDHDDHFHVELIDPDGNQPLN